MSSIPIPVAPPGSTIFVAASPQNSYLSSSIQSRNYSIASSTAPDSTYTHASFITNPVVPHGSIIFVTGVSGYIGSHVADQLLLAGYQVRGSTRSPEKNAWMAELFDQKYGKGNFELVGIADLTTVGAFDDSMKGVAGVVHVASDLTLSPNPKEVIQPTILGTLNCLNSAAKAGSVKRFVYTSSSTAAAMPKPNVKFEINTDSWNYESLEIAELPPPYKQENGYHIYGASKTRAEQELWKWVAERNPSFVVNTVLPDTNYGKSLSPKHQGQPSTSRFIQQVFEGDTSPMQFLPPQYFVDVQDTARLHVAALLHPEVENERVFAFAAPFNWSDITKILQKLYPNRKQYAEIPNEASDVSNVIPRRRAEQLLKEMGRPGWTSLEESIRTNTEELA